jgi:hypothetical protein
MKVKMLILRWIKDGNKVDITAGLLNPDNELSLIITEVLKTVKACSTENV